MCDVIERRGLHLKFEPEYEVWSLPLKESCCDLIKDQVRENKDGGLLLRNFGLRINGTKIECIDLRWD